MVSLHDIRSQVSAFGHLSTAIPSLDSQLMFGNKNSGIYDFQSVPACNVSHAVIISLISSHLHNNGRVVIVNCMNRFPISLLQQEPKFKPKWLENITMYTIDTFAKLMVLLAGTKLQGVGDNALLVLSNFHELVHLYNLQLTSAYKETILKFMIHRYETALAIKERESVEGSGSGPPLPDLPPVSDLLKASPTHKSDSHLKALMSIISSLVYKKNHICILTGRLVTKYEPSSMNLSTSHSGSQSSEAPVLGSGSSSISHISGSRPPSSSQVIAPAQCGKTILVPATSSVGNVSRSLSSSSLKELGIDPFLSMRVIFYREWYHSTPEFKVLYGEKISETNNSLLTGLYGARVQDLHAGSNNNVVYFDYDNGRGSQKFSDFCSFDWEDSSSTHPSEHALIDPPTMLPSSPFITQSTQKHQVANNEITHSFTTPPSAGDSVIEASDDDIPEPLILKQ